MKKLYSLVAIAALSIASYAQTTANYVFANQGFTNAQAVSGGTIDNNISYTTGSGGSSSSPTFYTADGLRLYSVRTTGDGNIVTFTPTNGATITSLVVQAFSTTYAQTMTYSVNGGAFQTATLSGTTYTISGINANSSLVIKNAYFDAAAASNLQTRVTSFAVTYSGGVLGVSDIQSVKSNFVKNTLVNNEINFGSKADVKIYNMNGQVVRTASVSENKNMEVSDLASGMYIVTGTVNGEAVSQKILKK